MPRKRADVKAYIVLSETETHTNVSIGADGHELLVYQGTEEDAIEFRRQLARILKRVRKGK